MQAVNPPGAEATQRAAVVLFDKLIADHPDNVEYQLGRSRCLMNQGAVLASAGRFDQAEATYRQALARVETKDPKLQTPEAMRLKALLLNNLADVFREVKRPGAEETLRRAMGIFEELASRATAGSKDRHDLAIARFNLGDTWSTSGDCRKPSRSSPAPRPTSKGSWPVPPSPSITTASSASCLASRVISWPGRASSPRPGPPWNAPWPSRPAPWTSARIGRTRGPCSPSIGSPWPRSA